MLLDTALGTRTTWKLLWILSEAPGKAVSKKEIQTITKLGNKGMAKFLVLLEKNELVIKKTIGRTSYYFLNMSNPITETILVLIQQEKKTLNNLDFTTLNILRDFIYELTNTNLENLQQVILFGSHAKRTHTATSDIDVAIITKEKNPNDELLITAVIDALKKRYHQEIQPHYFKEKEFTSQRKTSTLVQEILKDGVKLLQ